MTREENLQCFCFFYVVALQHVQMDIFSPEFRVNIL